MLYYPKEVINLNLKFMHQITCAMYSDPKLRRCWDDINVIKDINTMIYVGSNGGEVDNVSAVECVLNDYISTHYSRDPMIHLNQYFCVSPHGFIPAYTNLRLIVPLSWVRDYESIDDAINAAISSTGVEVLG